MLRVSGGHFVHPFNISSSGDVYALTVCVTVTECFLVFLLFSYSVFIMSPCTSCYRHARTMERGRQIFGRPEIRRRFLYHPLETGGSEKGSIFTLTNWGV